MFGLDVVDRLLCRAPMVVNDYLEFFTVLLLLVPSALFDERRRKKTVRQLNPFITLV